MIGNKYGFLLVVKKDTKRKGYVVCKCVCGNIKSIRATSLTKTKQPTKSCGCLQKRKASKNGLNSILKNSKKQIERNIDNNTNIQVISSNNPPKNNTSGVKGVSWNKEKEKWEAYIGIHNKRIRLGRFNTKAEAMKERLKAEQKYYKPILEKIEKEKENGKML